MHLASFFAEGFSPVGPSRVTRCRAGTPAMATAGTPPIVTRALLWTESYYDQDLQQWAGRVMTTSGPLGSVRALGSGLRHPTGLAVDPLRNTAYWTDSDDGTITRCDIGDGGRRAPHATCLGRLRERPNGLTLDAATDTLIWSDKSHPAIRRADLTGKNVQTVTEGVELGDGWSAAGPWGLALQPSGASASHVPLHARRLEVLQPGRGLGRVYYSAWGRIQCCEIGTGEVRDVVRGLVDPVGVALDTSVEGGRIFWTDSKAGKVQCAALDGSRVCDIATGLTEPFGIAVGPTHLFWTDRSRGAIQSCNLRTGHIRDVLEGLRSPEGIAALSAPAAMPSRRRDDATRRELEKRRVSQYGMDGSGGLGQLQWHTAGRSRANANGHSWPEPPTGVSHGVPKSPASQAADAAPPNLESLMAKIVSTEEQLSRKARFEERTAAEGSTEGNTEDDEEDDDE